MELQQLKYFVETAKSQSVTRAAEALCVAQPSVSQAIARLESELGVKLFDRVGKKIVLNSYGKLYLEAVQDVFARLDSAREELIVLQKTIEYPLTVVTWKHSSICPLILVNFFEQHPAVNITVLQESMSYIEENGIDYDIALVVGTQEDPAPYPNEVLFQEEINLAVNRNHPLAKYDSLPLSAAKDEPFIMKTGGTPMRRMTEAFCRLAGFTPKVLFENHDSDTLRRMIQLGMGVGFFPEYTSGLVDSEFIKLIKIETPLCRRTINVCWPEGKELSPCALLFIDFVKKFFKDNYGEAQSAQN